MRSGRLRDLVLDFLLLLIPLSLLAVSFYLGLR